MDTVTQITLGAAVGEAVLGKKMGTRAALWGAVMGVIPDLDVLVLPFASEVQALAIHRGISHSLLFTVAAAPIFGWLLNQWYSEKKAGWRSWSLLAFWCLLTHIAIDLCTSYGTQILQPFSDRLFSLNSIFIIDPFYTLPLMTGIVAALFMRRNFPKRRWANFLGIGISSLYLLAGFAVKQHVNDVFEQNFEEKNIRPEQYMTTPTPLNIALWNGYAVENDTLYAGLFSIFDSDKQIEFHAVPQNEGLLNPYRGQLPLERLLWFSQGYYVAEKNNDALLMHDLRFGRSDLWLTDQAAPFVWNYQLQFNIDSTLVTGFDRSEPGFDQRGAILDRLLNRIVGDRE